LGATPLRSFPGIAQDLEKLFGEAIDVEALAAPTPASDAILALGCLFWLAVAALALAAAFGVLCYWRICAKAGYSGAMSLLVLLPGVGAAILMCILAFGDWPGRDGRQGLETRD
jgi:energy-converting hydrogenase Eha subunit B